MAYSAGTYRGDGRGGAGSFPNDWLPPIAGPTTRTSTGAQAALADQAEIWQKDLWADLMILPGTALESMGFKTFGTAAGA